MAYGEARGSLCTVGRVAASQAAGRRFETGQPLQALLPNGSWGFRLSKNSVDFGSGEAPPSGLTGVLTGVNRGDQRLTTGQLLDLIV